MSSAGSFTNHASNVQGKEFSFLSINFNTTTLFFILSRQLTLYSMDNGSRHWFFLNVGWKTNKNRISWQARVPGKKIKKWKIDFDRNSHFLGIKDRSGEINPSCRRKKEPKKPLFFSSDIVPAHRTED